MSDGFDITSEEGDFIHINYVNSEETEKLGNDEELYGDENDWILVDKSKHSKPEPQLDYQDSHLEYELLPNESSHEEPCLDSSFYELVSQNLKENTDETVADRDTALTISEIEAEALYIQGEELNRIVPSATDITEYDKSNSLNYDLAIEEGDYNEFDYGDDIENEEYRFIHEYNEEIDMCTKSKAHCELLDIYPNSFMGLDSKNDLLGGRSRKRRCKKIALNKKTEISSPLYSFRINKDSLWVYKNA